MVYEAGERKCGMGNQKNPSILVVDDEEDILNGFSFLLKELDYEPVFTPKSEEALKMVEANPKKFDVIVTDVRMPGMNGIDFAKAVRAVNPDLPIVFMTGFPSDEVKSLTTQFKKVIYLEKPFNLIDTFTDLIPKLVQ